MSLAVYEHHTEIAMLLVHRGAYVNIVEEVNIVVDIALIYIATIRALLLHNHAISIGWK